jgi:hypothetical protein
MKRRWATVYGQDDTARRGARRPVFSGRRVLWLIALCGLAVLPVRAQEAEWQEAHDQIEKLNDAGRYSESLPLAITFLILSRFCVYQRDVLIARVIIHPYNDHAGYFLPSQWSSTNHSLLGSKEPTL